jgi:hypothetical protein
MRFRRDRPHSPSHAQAHIQPGVRAKRAAAIGIDRPVIASQSLAPLSDAVSSEAGSHEASVGRGMSGGVSGRVVMVCLLLALFFGYVIPIIDLKLYNTFLGSTHLPPGGIAVLLVLVLLVNPLLRVLHHQWAFGRNELITIYITCLFSTLIPGHGSANLFVSQIIGSFYYATRENRWLDFLSPHLKPWLTPALSPSGTYNAKVVEDWYVGLGPGDGGIPWGAWLVPLLAWGSLVFATYMMLGCLGVMLRAQWAEREALTFPLLRLPLELATESGSGAVGSGAVGSGAMGSGIGSAQASRRLFPPFFYNPLVWMGFSVAVVIHGLNGLNLYFPDVPLVPLELVTGPLLSEAPWNQIGPLPVVISLIAIGVSYLLTTEIAFSLWVFFWFFKFQYIALYYLGFPSGALPVAIGVTGNTKVFAIYQVIGAFFVYALLLVWTGREHLFYIVRRAFDFRTRRTPPQEAEKGEALSYPVAFWGFCFSFAFIVLWSVMAGIAWHVAFWMWTAYLVIALGLTRIVAEGGILFASQGWTALGPVAQMFGSGAGTWLVPSSVVPAAFIQASLGTDNRSMLLPGFIHSFKLARDHEINSRALWPLITACILISLAMTLGMRVNLGYTYGGLQLQNKWMTGGGAQLPATTLSPLIEGAHDFNPANGIWLLVGGLMTQSVMLARTHLLWFPLHPLGILMSLSYPMSRLWFSIFLGWGCKVLIMRFGTIETYRKLVPAFLGLVLGEVVMILFWLIIDGWQGRTSHQLIAG